MPELEVRNRELLGEGLPVVLDVEGGDHMPMFGVSAQDLVKGAQAAKENGVNVLVVGLEDTVAKSGLPFVIAQSVVKMGTSEKKGAIRDRGSSVNIAAMLVKETRASGFASTCDTAAMIGAATLGLGRYGSIYTPLVAEVPRSLKRGGSNILLDVGAFPEKVSSQQLARYGLMGASYARFLGIERPRVALMANGSEPAKGTEITREAHGILAAVGGDFELIEGFVEGKDLFKDTADVIVVDGFAGNLVLKTAEGAAMAVLESLPTQMRSDGRDEAFVNEAKNDIYALGAVFDPNGVGGAPILGVKGNALVMHGSSTALAATKALERLHRMAAANFQPALAAELTRFKNVVSAE